MRRPTRLVYEGGSLLHRKFWLSRDAGGWGGAGAAVSGAGTGAGPAARDAEIVVLNTCTVTESADKDARASIRRLQRVNPDCQHLVTGCYAQRAPEEMAALPGVTWVVGNSHKHQAAEIATGSSLFSSSARSGGFVSVEALSLSGRQFAGAEIIVGDIFAHTELMAAPVFEAANERTRPNLKMQDGCDNRCSFCVIPYVRGQSRSLPRAGDHRSANAGGRGLSRSGDFGD